MGRQHCMVLVALGLVSSLSLTILLWPDSNQVIIDGPVPSPNRSTSRDAVSPPVTLPLGSFLEHDSRTEQTLPQQGRILTPHQDAAVAVFDLTNTRNQLARRLEAHTKPVFEEKWSAGEYFTVAKLTPHLIQDAQGRPLPNSGRLTTTGIDLVVLTEELHPQAVGLIQNIADLDRELDSLRISALSGD